LDYLLETRKHLQENLKSLSNENVDKLLIICLLIKFLEEIKDADGKHTLKEIYKSLGITKLQDAFSENGNDKFLSVLKSLSKEFNGQIFSILDEHKEQIQKTNLSLLVLFLEAKLNIKTKQFFLWKQYNFNHLPIELISSIYENFLPKQKGVVYTPPFLVNFLIDEVMPLDKPQFENGMFKVLDPSCGSGVFLVAAYKRLLQWWSINHYNQTQQISFPDKTVCQSILEQNIFGVDIEPTATLISIFSLTITLLDKLSPKEIWNGLKFNDLQQNIKTKDFFEWASTASKDFDLVIGNPPFNDKNGKSNANIPKELVEKIGFKHKEVAGNKFALQFFEGANVLGKKTCLIIPSNMLLYNKAAQNYREKVFKNFIIHKIFDFTHLRETLFVKRGKGSSSEAKKGRTPVCAILAENQLSKQEPIEHIIIHRIVNVEKKLAFQIDHYDRHFVRWEVATNPNKQFVWKTNLLGGGRLFNLIDRLSMLGNLGSYLDNKVKNHQWTCSSGYRVEYKSQKAESVEATFITSKNTIEPKPFKEDGKYTTMKESATLFAAPRVKELYEPPHIIFKLVVENKKLPMAFVDEYLCFNSSFVGIAAPEKDRKELHKIYERLFEDDILSSLYRTFILATSPKAVVYHETSIIKEDIDNLPFPDNTDYLYPSKTESFIIDEVLRFYRHLGKSVNKDAKSLYQKITPTQLQEFGEVFCATMNEEHDHAEENRAWQIGDVLETDSFIAYQFIFGEIKNQNALKINQTDWQGLNKLVFNTEENSSAVFTRVARYYGSNSQYDFVWLIKPNTMRYWLNSIALRDTDDTFIDYFEIGY
jgi:hypothetical protein